MSLDTDVSESDTRAGVLLRVTRFDLMMRIVGCTSDLAIARLIGVNVKTIERARRGIIGEKFIAGTLAGLAKYEEQLAELGLTATFESLFEVGEKRTAA